VTEKQASLDFIGDLEQRETWRRAMASGPPAPNVRRDVVYAELDGEALKLDAYWPDEPGPHPMIVWIHGGGWQWGQKEIGDYVCRRFVAAGYSAFTIDYRLAPQHKFPAAVNDCMGAVAWVREHAEDFAGDPSRICIGGESAGGNLAAMVAYTAGHERFHPVVPGDAGVQAALLVYGAFDFTRMYEGGHSGIIDNYLVSLDDAAAASPITYVKPGGPPALLVVGDRDFLYDESIAFESTLAEAGIEHELVIVPGAEHAFIIWQWDEQPSRDAHPCMVAVMDRWLKP
jgi:acetyl esterase/lipase